MKTTYKILCIVLSVIFSLCITLPVSAAKPSTWAEKEVRAALRNGVVPDTVISGSYQDSISRAGLCNLLVTAYTQLTGNSDLGYIENPFYDTDDENVLRAYKLGIVSGVSENTFEPDRNVTRQEMAKMLCNTAKAMSKNIMINRTNNLKYFADNGSISQWAFVRCFTCKCRYSKRR